MKRVEAFFIHSTRNGTIYTKTRLKKRLIVWTNRDKFKKVLLKLQLRPWEKLCLGLINCFRVRNLRRKAYRNKN